ncbi:MAG: sigma-70 family RNA polymerase sigma factor [Balneolia bacterium]|nr:sigma-70 family RNA polymerase sigma factor [Balneolia bacterium]
MNQNMQHNGDSELVARCISGDEEAFAQLVSRWRMPLFTFAHRLTRNEDDAHDLTQRTFIKVHQKLDSLDDAARFSAWVYQIMMNQFRDWKRSQNREINRREMLAAELTNNEQHSQATTYADTQFEKSERKRLLHLAMNQLPEEQRTVLLLKEFQELTFREVAEVLDIPENTAKSRLYYSYKALGKIFSSMQLNKEDF